MNQESKELTLGRFELCLRVADINKSLEFYKKLGFKEIDGKIEEGWLIIKNSNCILGLYQGHISKNTLNFRGGDVFAIADVLKSQGLTMEVDAHTESDGSDGAEILDPDGNLIYFNTAPGEGI
ncbi:MAG: VOC family protein [candidate division WOR-3 bacterium]|nr:VOC family protein [candidate division WOR-3 bacterium]